MSDANAVSAIADDSWKEAAPETPAAILRGGPRGLEIHVDATATADAIAGAIEARLAEAPAFFRGSAVRIRVEDGPLAPGCLARIDDLAARFELSIVEVGACKAPADAVPVVSLASGSAPTEPEPEPEPEPGSGPEAETATATATEAETATATATAAVPETVTATVSETVAALEAEAAAEAAIPARTIVGPIRSGVVLEHDGHIVVFGDVNPGAEIRASGNIVVLGRLRGTAHAAIGRDTGFILSLRLEPQQLRIGRQLARASDSDAPGIHPEIAHVAGGNIVVERYLGRLPAGLGASI